MLDVVLQWKQMKITLFIPKIKLCWELKKTERKNMMLISWKQTFYVPLRRNWTKQYKLSIVLHQGNSEFFSDSLSFHVWIFKSNNLK